MTRPDRMERDEQATAPQFVPTPGGATTSADERSAVAPPLDRRLLDEIFGEVLPVTTGDERDPSDEPGYSEQWYRDNRPPHHGG